MNASFHSVMWLILIVIIVFTGFASNCGKKVTEEQESILATIGNRTITVEEFIGRTEMTLRPQYPNLNAEEVKRIYLNDLIAEKLMALEGTQEKVLLGNPLFQAKIKGIQEQKMREKLYNREVAACAQVDSNEIKQIFHLAGREYKISFYTINYDSLAAIICDDLEKSPDQFEPVFHQFSSLEKIPQKVVKFKDPDPVIINDSLFSKPLEVGQVIGPIKVESKNYIVIRIDDWNYHPAISTSDFKNRWRDVREKLIQKKSYYTWRNYKANLMKGKKVNFKRNTFNQLSKIFFTIYGGTDNDVKRKTYSEFMTDDTREIQFETGMFKDLLLDRPFFSIDDEVWTVRDFREAYMSYPLVIQYQSTNLKDFQPLFRDAILSMITDHFLTREAYKQELDKNPVVQRTRIMWKDALVAMFHTKQYIRKMYERNPDTKLLNDYLVMYIDSLQQEYGSSITINESALSNIKQSKINMYTIQPTMPYPVIFPAFPEYLQDNKFDYIAGEQAD